MDVVVLMYFVAIGILIISSVFVKSILIDLALMAVVISGIVTGAASGWMAYAFAFLLLLPAFKTIKKVFG